MICKSCGEDLPEEKFSVVKATSTYTRKSDGVTVTYHNKGRRKKCNKCVWSEYGADNQWHGKYRKKKELNHVF